MASIFDILRSHDTELIKRVGEATNADFLANMALHPLPGVRHAAKMNPCTPPAARALLELDDTVIAEPGMPTYDSMLRGIGSTNIINMTKLFGSVTRRPR